MRLRLTAEDVKKLTRRTEGWVAGLQLAALSMQDLANPAQFVSSFAGDDRYITDYLVSEVFERQPIRIQEFLLRTALFIIELEPYEKSELGISGVLPKGWNEVQPGVYARGNPEVDPTMIVQLAAPGESAESLALAALGNFGVSELPAEPKDSYESESLGWTLYQLESPAAPLALALADTDTAGFVVLMAAPGEEMDALVATLFFPAINALTPTAGL